MKYTFQKKTVNTVFKVKNIAPDRRTIRIFTYPILWNYSIDLLDIPEISESDIRHSLLKGELKALADKGFIEVVECTIDLTQFDSEQKAFLQSIGVNSGISYAPAAVANIFALSSLDDELFADGTIVSVSTVLDSFVLVKSSTETANNITVISTSSDTGRWHRQCSPNDYWRRHLNWWMDSVNGNDENSGTSESEPLKTFAEFRRRHGKQLLAEDTDLAEVTFKILDTGEVDQDIIVDMEVRDWPETLIIEGSQQVIYSGTITNYTPYNVSTQQEGKITDSNIPVSWTDSDLVGKQMVLTSGTSEGARGYIARDLGSKTAMIPYLMAANLYESTEPSTGNTYNIVEQTTIKGKIYVSAKRIVKLRYIQAEFSKSAWGNNVQVQGGQVFMEHCAITGTNGITDVDDGQLSMYGGMVSSDYGVNANAGSFFEAGAVLFSNTDRIHGGHGADLVFWANCVFDSSNTNDAIDAWRGGYIRIYDDTCFVNFGSGRTPINVRAGSSLESQGVLWGTTGNSPTYAIKVGSNGTIIADASKLKIEGGTTNDILLGSAGVAYEAARPTIDNTSQAKIVDRHGG